MKYSNEALQVVAFVQTHGNDTVKCIAFVDEVLKNARKETTTKTESTTMPTSVVKVIRRPKWKRSERVRFSELRKQGFSFEHIANVLEISLERAKRRAYYEDRKK